MRIVVILLVLQNFICLAVDRAPTVLKACIDFDNQETTISWNKVSDLCGSFVSYDLYGNVDSGPFVLIDKVFDINIESYTVALPDLNPNRCYFLRVKTLCDLLDSAQSLTLCIDQAFPSMTEIDSASVEVSTQDVIIGWTTNVTPDTRGYQVYDFTGLIGDSIGYTTSTFFRIGTFQDNQYPLVIATNDSCNLYAPLSSPHRVARLSNSIDTCAREIQLNWSLYSGWLAIDSQLVMVSINRSPFTKHTSVGSSGNSLTYSGLTLGDTLCFYIRSYTTQGGSITTSSSNVVCVATRELEEPTYVYLNNVDVINNQDTEITWELDNVKDQVSFEIEKIDQNGNTQPTLTLPTVSGNTTYSLIDNLVDVQSASYAYRIDVINKCNEVTALSKTSNSILLQLNNTTNHNAYLEWDGGVDEYALNHAVSSSSTWNEIARSSGLISFTVTDSLGCFEIVAYENLNSYGKTAISHSNTVCKKSNLQFYAPTALNMNSSNNRFIVVGVGIDHEKSRYQIVNRWGEIIADSPTNESWDATYKGKPVQPGIYIYILNVFGLEGERETEKGTINVLK